MENLTKKYLIENTKVDKLNDRYEYMAEEAGKTLSMCDKLLSIIDIKEKSKAVKMIKEIDKGFDKALMGLRNYLKFADRKIKL